jgi:hypothetical protein
MTGGSMEKMAVTWLAIYIAIGCLIAIISLRSAEPEKMSLFLFAIAHAFWPISLTIILAYAVFSPPHDSSVN